MNTKVRNIEYSDGECLYTIRDYDRTRNKKVTVVKDKMATLGGDYSTTCLTDLVMMDAKQAVNIADVSIGEELDDEECYNIIDRLNIASARLSRMIATMENEKKHPL